MCVYRKIEKAFMHVKIMTKMSVSLNDGKFISATWCIQGLELEEVHKDVCVLNLFIVYAKRKPGGTLCLQQNREIIHAC